MRVFWHIVWFLLIFLALTGLRALWVAATLQGPVDPETFGYIVGTQAIGLMILSALAVWHSSRKDWLPGLKAPKGTPPAV